MAGKTYYSFVPSFEGSRWFGWLALSAIVKREIVFHPLFGGFGRWCNSFVNDGTC